MNKVVETKVMTMDELQYDMEFKVEDCSKVVFKTSAGFIRYNIEEAGLELVGKWDCEINEETGELESIELEEWQVFDFVGLSNVNARLDLFSYVEEWVFQLEEEMTYMM